MVYWFTTKNQIIRMITTQNRIPTLRFSEVTGHGSQPVGLQLPYLRCPVARLSLGEAPPNILKYVVQQFAKA